MAATGLMSDAAVTVNPSICHPKTSGTVRLRSPRPEDPPVINYCLLGEPDDVVALAKVCRNTRAIFATATMRPYVLSERLPGKHVQNVSDWAAYLRSSAFRAEHPVGTCRMGNGNGAVVDERSRVRGIDGLRVIDASVIPALPSGNTTAPTIMVAERGADFVRETR